MPNYGPQDIDTPNPYLQAISQIESSGGTNLVGPPSGKEGERAGGPTQIMPATLRGLIHKYPTFAKDYGDLDQLGSEDLTQALATNKKMAWRASNLLHGELMQKYNGDHRKVAAAWLSGSGDTENTSVRDSLGTSPKDYLKMYDDAYRSIDPAGASAEDQANSPQQGPPAPPRDTPLLQRYPGFKDMISDASRSMDDEQIEHLVSEKFAAIRNDFKALYESQGMDPAQANRRALAEADNASSGDVPITMREAMMGPGWTDSIGKQQRLEDAQAHIQNVERKTGVLSNPVSQRLNAEVEGLLKPAAVASLKKGVANYRAHSWEMWSANAKEKYHLPTFGGDDTASMSPEDHKNYEAEYADWRKRRDANLVLEAIGRQNFYLGYAGGKALPGKIGQPIQDLIANGIISEKEVDNFWEYAKDNPEIISHARAFTVIPQGITLAAGGAPLKALGIAGPVIAGIEGAAYSADSPEERATNAAMGMGLERGANAGFTALGQRLRGEKLNPSEWGLLPKAPAEPRPVVRPGEPFRPSVTDASHELVLNQARDGMLPEGKGSEILQSRSNAPDPNGDIEGRAKLRKPMRSGTEPQAVMQPGEFPPGADYGSRPGEPTQKLPTPSAKAAADGGVSTVQKPLSPEVAAAQDQLGMGERERVRQAERAVADQELGLVEDPRAPGSLVKKPGFVPNVPRAPEASPSELYAGTPEAPGTLHGGDPGEPGGPSGDASGIPGEPTQPLAEDVKPRGGFGRGGKGVFGRFGKTGRAIDRFIRDTNLLPGHTIDENVALDKNIFQNRLQTKVEDAIARGQEVAKSIPPSIREQLNRVRSSGGSLDLVPEDLQAFVDTAAKKVDPIWREIDANHEELFKRGLISEKTYKRNKGIYFKRQYLAHLLDDWKPAAQVRQEAAQWLIDHEAGQGRLITAAKADEILDKMLEDSGKSWRGVGNVGSTLKKKNLGLAAPIRRFLGEVNDGVHNAMISLAEQRKILQFSDYYRNVDSQLPELWKRGPDEATTLRKEFEAIRGSRLTKQHLDIMGGLADKPMPKWAAQEIVDGAYHTDGLNRMMETALGVLKRKYTSYNPATHANNIFGNIWFSTGSGNSFTNPFNAKYYIQAIEELGTNGRIARLAADNGVLQGTFMRKEHRVFLEQLSKELARAQGLHEKPGELGRAWLRAKDATIKKIRETDAGISALYNVEDQIFKLSTFIKALGEEGRPEVRVGALERAPSLVKAILDERKGISPSQFKAVRAMTPREAALHVKRFTPDYGWTGLSIRKLRRNVLTQMVANPFVAFPLEAQRLSKNMMHYRPATMALTAASVGASAVYGGMFTGLPTEEVAKARRALPPYQREHLLVPYRSPISHEIHFLDLTHKIPLAEMFFGYNPDITQKGAQVPGRLMHGVEAVLSGGWLTGRAGDVQPKPDTSASPGSKAWTALTDGGALSPLPPSVGRAYQLGRALDRGVKKNGFGEEINGMSPINALTATSPIHGESKRGKIAFNSTLKSEARDFRAQIIKARKNKETPEQILARRNAFHERIRNARQDRKSHK